MEIWRRSILFYIAGCAYVGLELLWRGRSHGSMFLAGGLCFLLIGQLDQVQPRLPPVLRAMAGAMIITMVELMFGLLVNRSYGVWDYRHQPGNLWGQVCPGFSLVWLALAPVAERLYDQLEARLP